MCDQYEVPTLDREMLVSTLSIGPQSLLHELAIIFPQFNRELHMMALYESNKFP